MSESDTRSHLLPARLCVEASGAGITIIHVCSIVCGHQTRQP